MMLEVDGLQIHYRTAGGTVRAVDGASFAIPEGRIVGLVGESGCGKSTTGRCILQLERPTAGEVRFDGIDLTRLAPAAASSSRASRSTKRRPSRCCGATSPTCRNRP